MTNNGMKRLTIKHNIVISAVIHEIVHMLSLYVRLLAPSHYPRDQQCHIFGITLGTSIANS